VWADTVTSQACRAAANVGRCKAGAINSTGLGSEALAESGLCFMSTAYKTIKRGQESIQ